MEKNISDSAERQKALDITQSFIVRAPAGSGKTELLTNRFVNLLKTVKNPEEIIAITFTRKAAAEMRHRIISKLPNIDSSRLRIMTIDALCGFLVAQMPLKSKLGENFTVVENPDDLYQKAIENLFLHHQEKYLEDFLLYLDNDINRVNNLCTEILKSRDQWLPHIFNWTDQEVFVQAVSKVLILLVAELQVIFNTEEKYDFVEIMLRALDALGDEENPTDLALKLDYQIKHLLIDEFQDTSITQWRLLKKLTLGWERHDGRTLFLVGDPMQSIYRFRRAEVSLFKEVEQHGINAIRLMPIKLSANFRSDQKLIDWINQIFATNSEGIKNSELEKAVFYCPIDVAIKSEADEIISIIKKHPQEKIAILVRSRAHVKNIISVLHENKISFRAVEMANLSDHPLISDLFSLTKALLNPADRIAWLAILRAPWCGLTLERMHELFSTDYVKTIWELLLLGQPKEPRLNHFVNTIQWAMENRERYFLREWVEKTWIKLNGLLCLSQEQELKIAEKYFDLLDEYQDIVNIEKKLSSLSVPTDKTVEANVEIMTIHKAKGLEFDGVILCGLEKYTRADSSKLFLWEEKLNAQGEMDLWVAPIWSKLYDDLRKEENLKDDEELQRLFYVACTRAKKYLYLIFSVNIKNPAKKSFLNLLWPFISKDLVLSGKVEKQKEILNINSFKRLPDSVFTL